MSDAGGESNARSKDGVPPLSPRKGGSASQVPLVGGHFPSTASSGPKTPGGGGALGVRQQQQAELAAGRTQGMMAAGGMTHGYPFPGPNPPERGSLAALQQVNVRSDYLSGRDTTPVDATGNSPDSSDSRARQGGARAVAGPMHALSMAMSLLDSDSEDLPHDGAGAGAGTGARAGDAELNTTDLREQEPNFRGRAMYSSSMQPAAGGRRAKRRGDGGGHEASKVGAAGGGAAGEVALQRNGGESDDQELEAFATWTNGLSGKRKAEPQLREALEKVTREFEARLSHNEEAAAAKDLAPSSFGTPPPPPAPPLSPSRYRMVKNPPDNSSSMAEGTWFSGKRKAEPQFTESRLPEATRRFQARLSHNEDAAAAEDLAPSNPWTPPPSPSRYRKSSSGKEKDNAPAPARRAADAILSLMKLATPVKSPGLRAVYEDSSAGGGGGGGILDWADTPGSPPGAWTLDFPLAEGSDLWQQTTPSAVRGGETGGIDSASAGSAQTLLVARFDSSPATHAAEGAGVRLHVRAGSMAEGQMAGPIVIHADKRLLVESGGSWFLVSSVVDCQPSGSSFDVPLDLDFLIEQDLDEQSDDSSDDANLDECFNRCEDLIQNTYKVLRRQRSGEPWNILSDEETTVVQEDGVFFVRAKFGHFTEGCLAKNVLLDNAVHTETANIGRPKRKQLEFINATRKTLTFLVLPTTWSNNAIQSFAISVGVAEIAEATVSIERAIEQAVLTEATAPQVLQIPPMNRQGTPQGGERCTSDICDLPASGGGEARVALVTVEDETVSVWFSRIVRQRTRLMVLPGQFSAGMRPRLGRHPLPQGSSCLERRTLTAAGGMAMSPAVNAPVSTISSAGSGTTTSAEEMDERESTTSGGEPMPVANALVPSVSPTGQGSTSSEEMDEGSE